MLHIGSQQHGRIEWIDVAKGLLITLVLFHHFPKVTDYYNPVWAFFRELEGLYTPFFMASFFVITGYCSNFKKDFRSFFVNNFKSLLISNFFLCVLAVSLGVPFNGMESLKSLCSIDFWLFHSFWFFKALFLSKILFWMICNFINRKSVQCVLSVAISFGGVCLMFFKTTPDILAHRNGMIFTVFVMIGYLLKDINLHRNMYVLGSLIYLALLVVLFGLKVDTPFVDAESNLSLLTYPLYLVMALSGTCAVFLCSQFLRKNEILKILGMTTIVTYPLSSRIMSNFLRALHRFNELNSWEVGVLLYAFIPVLTLAICIVAYKIINTKYLKFLIGKF